MVCIDAPLINQMRDWPTGCESVSAVMALQALGEEIGPEEFIASYLPRRDLSFCGPVLVGPDPNQYFIGDPHKDDFWSYGCYAGAIGKALRSYCRAHEDFSYEPIDCTGYSARELFALLDQGIPVIFWATMFMKPSEICRTWKLEDNPSREISWGAHEHCLLLVGYDKERCYFNDPMDAADLSRPTHCLREHPAVVGYDRELVFRRHREKADMAVSFRKREQANPV